MRRLRRAIDFGQREVGAVQQPRDVGEQQRRGQRPGYARRPAAAGTAGGAPARLLNRRRGRRPPPPSAERGRAAGRGRRHAAGVARRGRRAAGAPGPTAGRARRGRPLRSGSGLSAGAAARVRSTPTCCQAQARRPAAGPLTTVAAARAEHQRGEDPRRGAAPESPRCRGSGRAEAAQPRRRRRRSESFQMPRAAERLRRVDDATQPGHGLLPGSRSRRPRSPARGGEEVRDRRAGRANVRSARPWRRPPRSCLRRFAAAPR